MSFDARNMSCYFRLCVQWMYMIFSLLVITKITSGNRDVFIVTKVVARDAAIDIISVMLCNCLMVLSLLLPPSPSMYSVGPQRKHISLTQSASKDTLFSPVQFQSHISEHIVINKYRKQTENI